MDDEAKALTAIEAELIQRLAGARMDGLRTGQLKMPASSTAKGKKYRQILKRLCAEKKVINLGTAQRPLYLLEEYFRPIERVSAALLDLALDFGRKLVSLSQFKKSVTPRLRPYCADALAELAANGRLIEFRWAAQTLYCHSDVISVTGPQSDSAQLTEQIERAYDIVVQDRGYPDVLIHDIHKHVQEVKVGDLVQFLQDACAQGKAIPSEGDWSLSTEEERQSAVTIGGDPHLRIRLLEVA